MRRIVRVTVILNVTAGEGGPSEAMAGGRAVAGGKGEGKGQERHEYDTTEEGEARGEGEGGRGRGKAAGRVPSVYVTCDE